MFFTKNLHETEHRALPFSAFTGREFLVPRKLYYQKYIGQPLKSPISQLLVIEVIV